MARISVVTPASDDPVSIYRLDFTVESTAKKVTRIFVLRPTDCSQLKPTPPVSQHMDHAGVLELANTWLRNCNCIKRRSSRTKYYPTRLIDLSQLKKSTTINAKDCKYHISFGPETPQDGIVNLVETANLDQVELERKTYVTLSHKWGGTNKPAKLLRETKEKYENGVKLSSLPKTFQEAIRFALRMDGNVHYIWIDSLCIIQRDPDDWLQESALMQEVYHNSFLNISATAAETSDDGLYLEHYTQSLGPDMITLNIDGFHKDTSGRSQENCQLLDVDWETLVDQAPVNRRGWVVQERLLAPRVLHFCRGRIAWECAEFEGYYPGVPNYKYFRGAICESIPLKGLEPGDHGKRLRIDRYRGNDDPLLGDTGELPPIVHSLELWARIVETYSRTHLTEHTDKLIAMSGLAHRMATIFSSPQKVRYVAGLWDEREYLVSQLLWYVESFIREYGRSDSTLEFPSKRPKQYRAPSFSWASVDAQYGRGITCGDILDPGHVLVRIPPDEEDSGSPEAKPWSKSVFIQLQTDNEFGVVTGGHIRLWAYLCRVKLQREGTRYFWSFGPVDGMSNEVSYEEHSNVVLDCPGDDDQDGRLTRSEEIYCMPVAPARNSTGLTCLLLKRASDSPRIQNWPLDCRKRTYERIGVSKLTLYFDHHTLSYFQHEFEGVSRDGNTDGRINFVYII